MAKLKSSLGKGGKSIIKFIRVWLLLLMISGIFGLIWLLDNREMFMS